MCRSRPLAPLLRPLAPLLRPLAPLLRPLAPLLWPLAPWRAGGGRALRGGSRRFVADLPCVFAAGKYFVKYLEIYLEFSSLFLIFAAEIVGRHLSVNRQHGFRGKRLPVCTLSIVLFKKKLAMKKLLLALFLGSALPAAASSTMVVIHCPDGDKLVRMENPSSFATPGAYEEYRRGVIMKACGSDCLVRIEDWKLPGDFFFDGGDLPSLD